jgi:sulfate transport system permease protein
LPTAVGGIALTAAYSENGWIGQYLSQYGIKAAFSPLGYVDCADLYRVAFRGAHGAAGRCKSWTLPSKKPPATLGANRWQTFSRVIFPHVLPAVLTGFALAFARALGEYGSVVFISGNMPMRTEITPLLIITKLEQYDYAGATGIAVVMLIASFGLLLLINGLQHWSTQRYSAT